jgi:putative peptidoglycan lipid II flippase
MGAALYLLSQRGAAHMSATAPIWEQIGVLGVLVGFGVVLYFTLVHITRAQPLGQLLRRLRRRG